MRLFAALMPPQEALDELERVTAPLRREFPALRWVDRSTWHVTVAFFGDVDEAAARRLVPRLEKAAAGRPPLTLSFAGAGVFPSGGAHARVVWTGVYGDRRPLARLAAAVTAAGRAAGAPLGDHRTTYRPHLTLARSDRPTDMRRAADVLAGFAGRAWEATTLHLVRSHFPKINYTTLDAYPLTG